MSIVSLKVKDPVIVKFEGIAPIQDNHITPKGKRSHYCYFRQYGQIVSESKDHYQIDFGKYWGVHKVEKRYVFFSEWRTSSKIFDVNTGNLIELDLTANPPSYLTQSLKEKKTRLNYKGDYVYKQFYKLICTAKERWQIEIEEIESAFDNAVKVAFKSSTQQYSMLVNEEQLIDIQFHKTCCK